MFGRKLRLLAHGCVENPCVWPCDQETRWIAVSIALNFTRWRIRSIFRVAASAQSSFVQHASAIQVQDENRCFGRNGVDFFERRHAPLGKLKFTPPTDDPDPLAWRRPLNLFF